MIINREEDEELNDVIKTLTELYNKIVKRRGEIDWDEFGDPLYHIPGALQELETIYDYNKVQNNTN